MKLLENNSIIEAAELIRLKAIEIKEDRNITEQEAFAVIFTDIEKHLGGINDDI